VDALRRAAGQAVYRLARAGEAAGAEGLASPEGLGRALVDLQDACAAAGLTVEEATAVMWELYPNMRPPQ
jgi:hypothetical protein